MLGALKVPADRSFLDTMNCTSCSSALVSQLAQGISNDPVQQTQQAAQVSVLKKAIQAQDDMVKTLLASTGSVGRNIDRTG